MEERFTPYDLEYKGVVCLGVDWEKYEFVFVFRKKIFYYTQKGYISCSADTDHIRCAIEEFKEYLVDGFPE